MDHPRENNTDAALLVLRLVALFLLVTFGWQKVWDLGVAIHAGGSLASSGLAPLLAKMGFPLPVLIAVSVALTESLGALSIATGFYTRFFALCAAGSMAGAFYTSAHFGWEPIRSLIYLIVFLALLFTGGGRHSLDFRLSSGRRAGTGSIDAGLLVLRLGLLIALVLLYSSKPANGRSAFAHGPALILLVCSGILAAPVVLGCYVRVASVLSALFWTWAALSGFLAGQRWDLAPYRDILFVLLFVALVFAGPGRFSLQGRRAAS